MSDGKDEIRLTREEAKRAWLNDECRANLDGCLVDAIFDVAEKQAAAAAPGDNVQVGDRVASANYSGYHLVLAHVDDSLLMRHCYTGEIFCEYTGEITRIAIRATPQVGDTVERIEDKWRGFVTEPREYQKGECGPGAAIQWENGAWDTMVRHKGRLRIIHRPAPCDDPDAH